MGGTRLEIFRFGFYLFVPIGMAYYFGLPSYIDQHVKPLHLYPAERHQVPTTLDGLREEVRKYEADREGYKPPMVPRS